VYRYSAVLKVLSSEEARELSPTELVTKAATAAMAAMPSAPLVHTILPSVVAHAVAMAPLAANRNTVDAPMAHAALVCYDRATDTEGLVRPVLCVDAATDAAPVTVEMRTGPDGASDPVLVAAPRDAATSPGASARVISRDVSTGVGTSTSPPPGRQVLRDTGCDPALLTFNARIGTDVDGAAVDAGVSAAAERDALKRRLTEETAAAASALAAERERAAAAADKAKKWKGRSESLRVDLAAAMEKAADAERRLADETVDLQLRLRAEESARVALERASQLRIQAPDTPGPPGALAEASAPPAPAAPWQHETVQDANERQLVAAQEAAAAAGARVVQLEEIISSRDRAGASAVTAAVNAAHADADAAQRDAAAAAVEAQRLHTELRGRDAEHAQMITALRSTIRGMRNSTPADRAAYLEVGLYKLNPS
jgi:hypothetical protein